MTDPRHDSRQSQVEDPSAPGSLGEVLDRIGQASGRDRVSFGMVLDAVGRRSFGPILLLAGVITVVPVIGDIPGVPTIMSVLVLLTGVQLLVGRKAFWLPQWILKRNVARSTLDKSVRRMRRPASWLDRITHERLSWVTRGAGVYLIAAVCLGIALSMPPMELIPFVINGAGLALTIFGLALIGHDGLLALVGVAVTVGTYVGIFMGLV